MLDVKEFGMRMKEARMMHGMTHKELAEKTFYSEKSVQKAESDDSIPPSLNLAIAIAEALHVDLEWLCGLQDMPRRADSIEW